MDGERSVRRPGPARGAVTPGYGLFATSDGGQVALGVVNEQHFWDALCAELGLGALAGLDVEERIRRGADLQEAVASTVATRERDQLVAALVGVGVPVAPVLDRTAMLDSAPFPSFPIRLPLPDTVAAVPALDEHNGQGFHERP